MRNRLQRTRYLLDSLSHSIYKRNDEKYGFNKYSNFLTAASIGLAFETDCKHLLRYSISNGEGYDEWEYGKRIWTPQAAQEVRTTLNEHNAVYVKGSESVNGHRNNGSLYFHARLNTWNENKHLLRDLLNRDQGDPLISFGDEMLTDYTARGGEALRQKNPSIYLWIRTERRLNFLGGHSHGGPYHVFYNKAEIGENTQVVWSGSELRPESEQDYRTIAENNVLVLGKSWHRTHHARGPRLIVLFNIEY